MTSVSQREPYMKRLDRITAEMETSWRTYGFNNRQEMIDWFFGWQVKYTVPILNAGQPDARGALEIRDASDMLRLYPIGEFRSDEALSRGYPWQIPQK